MSRLVMLRGVFGDILSQDDVDRISGALRESPKVERAVTMYDKKMGWMWGIVLKEES